MAPACAISVSNNKYVASLAGLVPAHLPRSHFP